MDVIGVAGQARNAKDTIADRLHLKLDGLPWKRASFASNVKRIYCETFGVDLEFVEKWKVIKECPPGFTMNVRQGLQFIGDGFRKICPTIWLDLVFRDRTDPIIISDVRYPNEFVRVHQEGGLNIMVIRPDHINDDPNGSEAEIKPYLVWFLEHFGTAEKFIDFRSQADRFLDVDRPKNIELFDVVIINDRSKEDLLELVETKLVPYVVTLLLNSSE